MIQEDAESPVYRRQGFVGLFTNGKTKLESIITSNLENKDVSTQINRSGNIPPPDSFRKKKDSEWGKMI